MRVDLLRVMLLAATACGRVHFDGHGDAGGDGRPADGIFGDVPDDASMPVTALVSDDFERTVAGAWGAAPLGGAWQVYNPNGATVGVAGGAATVQAVTSPTYADFTVTAPSAGIRDVETRVVVAFDRLPTSTGSYGIIAVARWVAVSNAYDLYVELQPGGSLLGNLLYERPGTGAVDITPLAVALPSVGPNDHVVVALRATGVSPTMLCGRVWLESSAEPLTCTFSAQDSTIELQGPGDSYLSASTAVGPVPVTFSFFSFEYLQVGAQ